MVGPQVLRKGENEEVRSARVPGGGQVTEGLSYALKQGPFLPRGEFWLSTGKVESGLWCPLMYP